MMRSSAPRPKAVAKKKIKKKKKTVRLNVPRHALEQLPNDYIVARGNGGGTRPRAIRSRVPSLASIGEDGDGAGGGYAAAAPTDPTGRPRHLGTSGLPTVADVTQFLGRQFVGIGDHLRALARGGLGGGEASRRSGTPFHSAPASLYSDDSTVDMEDGGYETTDEGYENYYDEDPPQPAQAPVPAPALAPAVPSAPPLPQHQPDGTTRDAATGTDPTTTTNGVSDDVYFLRIAELYNQLQEAREALRAERDNGNQSGQLRARIRELEVELSEAERTVAVLVPVRHDLIEYGTQTDPVLPDPVPIQDGPGQRELDLEEEVADLQEDVAARNHAIHQLETALQQQQHASNERYAQIQAALFEENERLIRTRNELARALQRPPTAHAETMTEQTATVSTGVGTPQALAMVSTGVGTPQAPAMVSTGVGTPQTPTTRTMQTGTEDQMAIRRTVTRPGSNQHTPDMRRVRGDERDDSEVTRARPNPRQGPTRALENGAERGESLQRSRPNPPQGVTRERAPDDRVPAQYRRPAAARRLDFSDPPAAADDTDNRALVVVDAPTAGAVARQEEFVPIAHNHAPAAEVAGRGRGRGRGAGAVHNHPAAEPLRRGTRTVRLTPAAQASAEQGYRGRIMGDRQPRP